MTAKRTVIVGAAGQAREVEWYLEEMNREHDAFELAGFVVSDLGRLGPRDSRDRVLGDYAWLEAHRKDVDALILGIGSPQARLQVGTELAARFPEMEWPLVAHPSVRIDWSRAKVGKGVLVGAGVVATVNVELGDFCMLNFGATVGHETRVGRGCVVNPGANLSGGVVLEDGVLVGAGAEVAQEVEVKGLDGEARVHRFILFVESTYVSIS